jgi:hypothetical protein
MARLCGLVVRVPDNKSRGPRFDTWRYHIFCEALDLEWGPLIFVSTTEEFLERSSDKPKGRGFENR